MVDRTVRIVAALVNPTGPAPEAKRITMLNASPHDVDLAGWSIGDAAKRGWCSMPQAAEGWSVVFRPSQFPDRQPMAESDNVPQCAHQIRRRHASSVGVAPLMIAGVMSEPAFGSRRATTASASSATCARSA
jgi:hypothetical protein